MKALVLEDYKRLVYRVDYSNPSLRGPDDVIVRVKAAAICGSDVHGWDGSTGRRIPPLVMGHEAAGEIVEVGPAVRGFAQGDRVTFDSTEYCGVCFHCRRGEVNLCDDRKVLGVSCAEYRRDGAFAEYVVLPQRILYRLPEALDFIAASIAEPAAVAAHAASLGRPELGESMAVVGAGLIGLLLIQILRANASGRIVALDTDPSRRKAALTAGADEALDPADPDLAPRLLGLSSGRGFDRVFEAVGATTPIASAIAAARKGGTVTLIGNLSPKVELPLQSVVTRQIRLQGSCATAGEYPLVLDLLASGKLDPGLVVSAVAPLADGASWFERLYARETGLLKVVLQP